VAAVRAINGIIGGGGHQVTVKQAGLIRDPSSSPDAAVADMNDAMDLLLLLEKCYLNTIGMGEEWQATRAMVREDVSGRLKEMAVHGMAKFGPAGVGLLMKCSSRK